MSLPYRLHRQKNSKSVPLNCASISHPFVPFFLCMMYNPYESYFADLLKHKGTFSVSHDDVIRHGGSQPLQRKGWTDITSPDEDDVFHVRVVADPALSRPSRRTSFHQQTSIGNRRSIIEKKSTLHPCFSSSSSPLGVRSPPRAPVRKGSLDGLMCLEIPDDSHHKYDRWNPTFESSPTRSPCVQSDSGARWTSMPSTSRGSSRPLSPQSEFIEVIVDTTSKQSPYHFPGGSVTPRKSRYGVKEGGGSTTKIQLDTPVSRWDTRFVPSSM